MYLSLNSVSSSTDLFCRRTKIFDPFCSTAKVISPWKCFTSQDHRYFLAEYDYPIYWKTYNGRVLFSFWSLVFKNGSNNIWFFFLIRSFCSFISEMFEEITFPLGPRALKGQWMICAPDIIDEDKTQNYCIKFYVTGAII